MSARKVETALKHGREFRMGHPLRKGELLLVVYQVTYEEGTNRRSFRNALYREVRQDVESILLLPGVAAVGVARNLLIVFAKDDRVWKTLDAQVRLQLKHFPGRHSGLSESSGLERGSRVNSVLTLLNP